MREALIVSLLIATALTGCSEDSPSTAALPTVAAAVPAVSSTAATNLANSSLLPTSATLHLLAAPLVALSVPEGNETLIATKNPLSGPQYFVWNATLAGKGNLTGIRTSLLLRLTQSAAQSGGNNDPGCTATATLIVRSNGTDTGYAGGCGSLGMGVLGPGDHRVEFSAPPGALPGIHVGPGDEVILQIGLHIATSGLGPTAFVIGGAPTSDSWIRLDGLREPLLAAPQE